MYGSHSVLTGFLVLYLVGADLKVEAAGLPTSAQKFEMVRVSGYMQLDSILMYDVALLITLIKTPN